MSKLKKIEWLAFMQIVCTLLIVFSHSVVVGIEYPIFLGQVIRVVQIIGLTAFMWCSGYLLVRTNSIEKHGYKKYIKKRFTRLMVPFFVVQFLMLIPKIIIGKISNSSLSYSAMDIIGGFINPRNGILPHLWFLPTLMILTLVSPVLLKIIKNKIGAFLLLVGVLVLACLPRFPNYCCANDVSRYLFWYSFGVFVAQNTKEDIVQDIKRNYLYLAMVISVPAFLLITKTVPISSLNELSRSFFSLIFLVSLSILVNKGAKWGRYTFPVYILSLPAQNIVEIALRKFQFGWCISTIIMFLIGVTVPMLISYIVTKIEVDKKICFLSKIIGL